MAAILAYQWDYIAAGANVGIFLHPFGSTDLGVFDALPIDIPSLGTSQFEIKLTQGEVSIFYDSFARTTYVQNLSLSNDTGAQLYFISA
jgi:hypothetical protein